MNSSNSPLDSPDVLPDLLAEPTETAGLVVPVEGLVGTVPTEPSPSTDRTEEILQLLARLEIKLDSLLSRPPIVAHIDPSEVAEYIFELINNGYSFPDIRAEMEKGAFSGSP